MATVTLVPTSTTSEAGWASSNIHTILDDDSSTVAQNSAVCDWQGVPEDLDSSLSGATINSVKVTFKAQRGGKGNTTAGITYRTTAGDNIIIETLSYTDASNPESLETATVTTQHDGATALTFSYINDTVLRITPASTGITAHHLFITVDYTAAAAVTDFPVSLTSGKISLTSGRISI
jgi:hypothetical protein